MSRMASNYNLFWLFAGQGVILLAALFAVGAIPTRLVSESSVGTAALATITVAYGIMMFASSYVEEEQHFWYWATTAWFFVLAVKGFSR